MPCGRLAPPPQDDEQARQRHTEQAVQAQISAAAAVVLAADPPLIAPGPADNEVGNQGAQVAGGEAPGGAVQILPIRNKEETNEEAWFSRACAHLLFFFALHYKKENEMISIGLVGFLLSSYF